MPPPSFFYRVIGFFGLLISGYYSILLFLSISFNLRDFGINAFIPHMPDEIFSSTVELLIHGVISLTVFLLIMYTLQKKKLFSYIK